MFHGRILRRLPDGTRILEKCQMYQRLPQDFHTALHLLGYDVDACGSRSTRNENIFFSHLNE